MKRRQCMAVVGAGGFGFLAAAVAGAAQAFSESDAASAVRVALERGADAAVSLLGRTDGFLGNPKVRIPLPGALADAERLLRAAGQGKRADELVTAMNRAAESAVTQARPLLLNAVKSMSVDDARNIVRGGDDSVTRFFVAKTREPLTVKFLPVVAEATRKVSLAEKYNALAGRAQKLGLVKPEDASIEQYVTGKALDGLFTLIGEEERKIRENPAATGAAILKRVFGGLR